MKRNKGAEMQSCVTDKTLFTNAKYEFRLVFCIEMNATLCCWGTLITTSSIAYQEECLGMTIFCIYLDVYPTSEKFGMTHTTIECFALKLQFLSELSRKLRVRKNSSKFNFHKKHVDVFSICSVQSCKAKKLSA